MQFSTLPNPFYISKLLDKYHRSSPTKLEAPQSVIIAGVSRPNYLDGRCPAASTSFFNNLCTSLLNTQGYLQRWKRKLVTAEKVSSINFVLNIIETAVITIGNDRMAQFFELSQIIDDQATKER